VTAAPLPGALAAIAPYLDHYGHARWPAGAQVRAAGGPLAGPQAAPWPGPGTLTGEPAARHALIAQTLASPRRNSMYRAAERSST